MRKKGIILSEPLGILIALLVMLTIFAFLYIIDQQNQRALAQSIEIGQRASGIVSVPEHIRV